MNSRIAAAVARRYLSASVSFSEGDVVEHVEEKIHRYIYVEVAHDTGGNYRTSLNGRVLWSQDKSEVGMYLELDEQGVIKNRGKGSKAKADAIAKAHGAR
jgi:hypothetical protein